MKTIFILKDQKREGPFDEGELRIALNESSIAPGTLAWKPGQQEWVALEDLLLVKTVPEREGDDIPSRKVTTHWKPLSRDFVILLVLQGIGGLIVGFAATDMTSHRIPIASATATFLQSVVAFAIIGCLSPVRRWQRLFQVMALNSVFNLLAIPILSQSIQSWGFITAVVFAAMWFGGMISLRFVPQPRSDDTAIPTVVT